MFFNQAGKPAAQSPDATRDDRTGDDRTAAAAATRKVAEAEADRRQVARRRTLALGMAVQFAVPVTGLVAFARSAHGGSPVTVDTTGTPTAAPADAALRKLFGIAADGSVDLPKLGETNTAAAVAYDKAIGQLRDGRYAEAAKTLRAIGPTDVGEADANRVETVMVNAGKAARSQKAAGDDLAKARNAAANGHAAEAAAGYRSAANNAFADAATRQGAVDGGLALMNGGTPTAAPVLHADVTPTPAPAVASSSLLALSTEQQTPGGGDLAPATPGPAPATVPADTAPPANTAPPSATVQTPPPTMTRSGTAGPSMPGQTSTSAQPTMTPGMSSRQPTMSSSANSSDAQQALTAAVDLAKIKQQQQQFRGPASWSTSAKQPRPPATRSTEALQRLHARPPSSTRPNQSGDHRPGSSWPGELGEGYRPVGALAPSCRTCCKERIQAITYSVQQRRSPTPTREHRGRQLRRRPAERWTGPSIARNDRPDDLHGAAGQRRLTPRSANTARRRCSAPSSSPRRLNIENQKATRSTP